MAHCRTDFDFVRPERLKLISVFPLGLLLYAHMPLHFALANECGWLSVVQSKIGNEIFRACNIQICKRPRRYAFSSSVGQLIVVCWTSFGISSTLLIFMTFGRYSHFQRANCYSELRLIDGKTKTSLNLSVERVWHVKWPSWRNLR